MEQPAGAGPRYATIGHSNTSYTSPSSGILQQQQQQHTGHPTNGPLIGAPRCMGSIDSGGVLQCGPCFHDEGQSPKLEVIHIADSKKFSQGNMM
ncbi:hypothetical protein EYF80_050017 [Liparis tanakae]|uniref:Uncharacterized protein n=1 Tax=Liparis tanakae TaxID=230148 RepID=A0A4Z2FF73_9TELE|nr:hypothetical protein EYF80_050017 [Liparis tanakae]